MPEHGAQLRQHPEGRAAQPPLADDHDALSAHRRPERCSSREDPASIPRPGHTAPSHHVRLCPLTSTFTDEAASAGTRKTACGHLFSARSFQGIERGHRHHRPRPVRPPAVHATVGPTLEERRGHAMVTDVAERGDTRHLCPDESILVCPAQRHCVVPAGTSHNRAGQSSSLPRACCVAPWPGSQSTVADGLPQATSFPSSARPEPLPCAEESRQVTAPVAARRRRSLAEWKPSEVPAEPVPSPPVGRFSGHGLVTDDTDVPLRRATGWNRIHVFPQIRGLSGTRRHHAEWY